MNIRYEILRRKDKNRALSERRKLLKQWTWAYEVSNRPGKDHRSYHESYLRHLEEIRCLTLEIDLNGFEILRLRAILKSRNRVGEILKADEYTICFCCSPLA